MAKYLEFDMMGLELVVGSGALAILAGMKGPQVVGLDICDEAVDLARKNWTRNNLEMSRGEFYASVCIV